MADEPTSKGFLPPRWIVRTAWATHRGLYRISGGRMGVSRPKPGKWGTLRLTTIGRKTGQERSVMLGYFEDGQNYVTMAMNGWADPEPAWWLNLQANPEATADVDGEDLVLRGRAAEGEERERLWDIWRGIDKNLDGYASRRTRETAVVILEPLTHDSP